jgi:L-threonylcarbamoyladenylate synthase
VTRRPEIIAVNATAPEPEIIARAAVVIRSGGLVGMPTETVYGLAANALDPACIAKIYAAKGRPSHNPLIAHVADRAQAEALAAEWPLMARELAARFWPGPMTLVVRKKAIVPAELSAGLDTFGVRVPDHPVALALIRACGFPLAAPSANRFTEVSPVTAAQVARGLGASVDLILDAGHTRVGLESTVIDVSGGRPVMLRPGMLTREAIEVVVGPVGRAQAAATENAPRPAPGMIARHYAPKMPMRIVRADDFAPELESATRELMPARVGVLTHSFDVAAPAGFRRRLPESPDGYAAALYDSLHDAGSDDARCELLLVEAVPESRDWDAIRDRLARAAHAG